MFLIDFKFVVDVQVVVWKFMIVGEVGLVWIKVLCMDVQFYEVEVYDYNEGLLVFDGMLRFEVEVEMVVVGVGQMYFVCVGMCYVVLFGSYGMFVIIDV